MLPFVCDVAVDDGEGKVVVEVDCGIVGFVDSDGVLVVGFVVVAVVSFCMEAVDVETCADVGA